MQDDEYPQSLVALTLLEDTSERTFDLSLDGPRLRPIFIGSRSKQTFEVYYHSFVDYVACGRWAIIAVVNTCRKRSFIGFAVVSQFRKYLSIAVVFTNFDVDPRNSLDTSLIYLIVS